MTNFRQNFFDFRFILPPPFSALDFPAARLLLGRQRHVAQIGRQRDGVEEEEEEEKKGKGVEGNATQR